MVPAMTRGTRMENKSIDMNNSIPFSHVILHFQSGRWISLPDPNQKNKNVWVDREPDNIEKGDIVYMYVLKKNAYQAVINDEEIDMRNYFPTLMKFVQEDEIAVLYKKFLTGERVLIYKAEEYSKIFIPAGKIIPGDLMLTNVPPNIMKKHAGCLDWLVRFKKRIFKHHHDRTEG